MEKQVCVSVAKGRFEGVCGEANGVASGGRVKVRGGGLKHLSGLLSHDFDESQPS